MHETQIRRIGGSVMLCLPKRKMVSLGWDVGTDIKMEIAHGALVVEQHDARQVTVESILLTLREKGLLDRIADDLPASVVAALPAPHRLTFAQERV